MAVGKFNLVDSAIVNIANGTIDLDADTFTAVLLDAAHTWDAADSVWSDVSANEIADGDYAQIAVSGMTVAQIANGAKVDCNDFNFGATVTIEGKWLYLVKGTPGALAPGDTILGGQDLDDTGAAATQSSTSGTFSVSVHADGLFDVTRV